MSRTIQHPGMKIDASNSLDLDTDTFSIKYNRAGVDGH